MKYSGLLHPFRNRVLCESLLKSLLTALAACAFSVFCLSFVSHLLIQELSVVWFLAVGGAAFILGFAVRFAFLFPSEKKVARRMDEMGLSERVSTMVEYKDDPSGIAAIQRSDAALHIGKFSAGQLKFRFRKAEWITCLVCVCLAAGMLLLPLNIFAFSSEEDEAAEQQQQIIRDFIQDLRDEVKEAALEEALKEDLEKVIDELEKELKDAASELEQAAEIEQAKRKIDEMLESALTKNQIGEALQRYDLTQALGEAVSDGDTEKVSEALDELEKAMEEDPSQISELEEDIADALTESGVDPSDSLYSAFSDFAEGLGDTDQDSEETDEELEGVFDTAEEEINAALEEQNQIEEEKEKLDDSMSDAKDEVLGNEPDAEEQEGEEGEEGSGEPGEGAAEGEQPSGMMPDGEMPSGEMPAGEMPDDASGFTGDGSEVPTMTEKIYDPISGSVSYGEVFAAYYADYLEALEEGDVPDDLQEIIDSYFSSLN